MELELVYNDETGLWEENKEPFACIEVETEEDFKRLCELIKADKEGRCIVLPCKPSDVTVYQLRSKKHAKGRGISPRHIACTRVWGINNYQLEHQGEEPCRSCDFGKTWFIDEESAKTALNLINNGENKNG